MSRRSVNAAADGQDGSSSGGAPDGAAGSQDEAGGIRIRLDELLSQREMTLTELSARVGVTIVNLSILKNGHARAVRFSTLAKLCAALDCQPGDLLAYNPPRSQ